MFNDWINRCSLIEIDNVSRTFTWGNNQDDMIMTTLDRVFITTDSEALFPVVHLEALPRFWILVASLPLTIKCLGLKNGVLVLRVLKSLCTIFGTPSVPTTALLTFGSLQFD